MADKSAGGTGQTQKIDIVITDKGADVAKTHIVDLGKAAKAAGADVDALNKLLGRTANTNSIVQAAAANDRLTASINKTADAYLKQETALNRAIVQEARAAKASAELAIAQDKVKISNNEVQISYLKTEQALNEAIRSENRAKISAIELANATDSQSVSYLRMEQALNSAVRAETMAATAAVQLAMANDRQAAAAQRAADAEKAKAAAASAPPPSSITQAGALGSTGARRPFGADPGPIGQAADNMGRLGRNTRLANHEMVNLGYQVQDIFISLAGGQNPFLVLLQQGSQIQSIYGGRGESVLKAFGDIGAILLRLINPATVAAAALAAGTYAVATFANKARDIQNTAKILQLSTDEVQNLGRALSSLSGGQLGFDNLKTDVKDFGVAAADAARNADSQFARLWKSNGLSLKDQNGKLKDVNALLLDASRLIRNAGSEFDKIAIARIMGLSEDWIRTLEKGPSAILGAENAAKEAGSTLDKELIQRAAQFDKDWEESWNKFKQKASDVITEVKAWLFQLSQQDWQINLSGNDKFTGFPTVDDSRIRNPDPNAPSLMTEFMKWVNNNNVPYGEYPKTVDDPLAERFGWLVDRQTMRYNRSLIENRPDAASNENTPIVPTGGSQYPVIPGLDLLPSGGTTTVPTTGKPKDDKSAEKRADALAKVNRELEAELKLFGMLGPEREKQQKYDDINNSLLQKKIELTATESEGIREKIDLIVENNRVQQEMDAIYQEFGTAQQHYNDVLKASNALLEKGVINQRQWARAVGDARISVLENSDNIGDGIELGFLRIQQQSGSLSNAIGDTLVNSVNSASDALTEFFSTGMFNSTNFVNSVIGDIARLVVQYKIIQPILNSLIGGGSNTPAAGGDSGGWLGSLIGSVGNWLFGGSSGGGPAITVPTSPGTITTTPLPAPDGFAGGGSFIVGGSGGTDKTPVAFGATRGERVTVETPAQQMRQASSMIPTGQGPAVQVNIDNSGANGVTVEQGRERQNSDGSIAVDLIVKRTKNEIANDMARGGNPIANSTGMRFGLNQAAGNRQ